MSLIPGSTQARSLRSVSHKRLAQPINDFVVTDKNQQELKLTYQCISSLQCKTMLDHKPAILIDIRDTPSYETNHIKNALHAERLDMAKFLGETDFGIPLIIYCYHGVASLSVAEFFSEQGFKEVYSLEEGFAGWDR